MFVDTDTTDLVDTNSCPPARPVVEPRAVDPYALPLSLLHRLTATSMNGNCFLHTWDALRHQQHRRSSSAVYSSSRCDVDRLSLLQQHRTDTEIRGGDLGPTGQTAADILKYGNDQEWLPVHWWKYVCIMEQRSIRVWVRDDSVTLRCVLMVDPGTSPSDAAVTREHPEKSPLDPIPLCDAWHILYDSGVHFEPLSALPPSPLPAPPPRPSSLLTSWLAGPTSAAAVVAVPPTLPLRPPAPKRPLPLSQEAQRSPKRLQTASPPFNTSFSRAGIG
jgi:hypothetical protein